MGHRGYLLVGVVAALLVLAAALGIRRRDRAPVRLGFAGQLTGRQADLGVDERNGIELAIDEHNRAGGIHGRRIVLMARDDAGTPEGAQAADRDLMSQGVVAILGHATSGQTLAGLAITEPAGMIMVGPTISTPALTGLDDHFFRVYPSFRDSARAFARHIRQDAPSRHLAILVDVDNASYTEAYTEAFLASYSEGGGGRTEVLRFSSAARPDFGPLLAGPRGGGVDALLIVASDHDAALIAQRARHLGWKVPLFAAAWAQTTSLIQNGGRAVEGLRLEQSFAPSKASPRYAAFARTYEERFGRPPSFGSAFGYEAAQVLLAALVRTQGRREGLKEALLATRDFPGLLDTFSLDPFGDVQRPFYLSEVEGGRFRVLGRLSGPEAK